MDSQVTTVKAQFAGWELDFRSGELTKNGRRVRLQEQPFRVLQLLLEHAGDVVSREELQRQLWSGETFVDFEHGLNKAISKLRDALDDPGSDSGLLETLPRRGYRFTSPVKWVTEANGKNAVLEQTPCPQPIPIGPHWRRNAAIALVACAAVGTVLYLWLGRTIARLNRIRELQRLSIAPLVLLPGNVASPTFSPDGSQIAFAWDGENNGAGYDLYSKAIGTDKPLRLTHHPARWLSAAWSPDGRSIAISRAAGEIDSGIFLLPPTGGPERKVSSRGIWSAWGNEISWSPDGRLLAFTDQPENSKSNLSVWLFFLKLDTLERTVGKTGCDTVFFPAFSPRGDYLAWACRETQTRFSVNAQRVSDGRTVRLAEQADGIQGLAWSADGRGIVFSAPSGDLWEVPLVRPYDAQKLPIGHDANDIAVSPSGRRLAYVQGVTNINIWRLDLLASPPKASKLAESSWIQRPGGISPDGSRIAFESNRNGSMEVWICDADGSNALQLSYFGSPNTGTPRWSPDGSLIAFDSRIGGEANIYVVDPAGGAPRRIEIDNARGNSTPNWSRNGKWIYFNNGDDAAKQSVWKVQVTAGPAVQIATANASYAIESPDGEYVYFIRNKRLWRVRTDGSSEQVVRSMPELNYLGDEWFPSGLGIYFMSHSSDKAAIEYFDLTTEKVRRVYELEKPAPLWVGGMPVSSDGKWLLFPQVDQASSNLMMIENWR